MKEQVLSPYLFFFHKHQLPHSLTHIFSSPHFDRSVLGRCVEKSIAPPLHAGGRLSVARQDFIAAPQHGVPDAHRAVLRGARQVATLWISGRNKNFQNVKCIKSIFELDSASWMKQWVLTDGEAPSRAKWSTLCVLSEFCRSELPSPDPKDRSIRMMTVRICIFFFG